MGGGMVALPQRGPLRPPGAAFCVAAAALALFSLCAVSSESKDVRPSDHGLAFQKNATMASPAMAAFFRGEGGGGATVLPEARNATGSTWALDGVTPMVASDGRDRLRTVLLTVGVVCGAAGVALLAAAAVAFLVQTRRAGTRRRRRSVSVEGQGSRERVDGQV